MLKQVLLSAILLCIFNQVNASPWINADDKYLHSSIQILQKSGHLSLPLSSYPISWVSVLQQLAKVDRTTLTENEILALQRILNAADFAQQEHIQTLVVSASSEPVSSGLQGARFDESALISVMTEHKGHNWAFGIRSNFRVDARDDKQQHFDGSYFAYTINNWVLSVAQQPLWLGTMHVQNEQLNWQGRAPKTIQINKLNPNTSFFSNKVVATPIAAKVILGEMPSSVSLSDSRFMLASINVLPKSSFELGFTLAQLRDTTVSTDTEQPKVTSKVEDIQLDARYYLGAASLYGQIARQKNKEHHANQFSLGADYHFWLKGWQSTFFTEYKSYNQHFISWRQPESFQESPALRSSGLKTNTVIGAYFFQQTGIGLSVKANHIRYGAEQPATSSQLYNVSAQYPLLGGLVTAEINHNTEKGQMLSSRWIGAVRYEYRW